VTASSIVTQCFSVAGPFNPNDWAKRYEGLVKIMSLFNTVHLPRNFHIKTNLFTKLITPNWNTTTLILTPVAILREQQYSNALIFMFYTFYHLKSTSHLPTLYVSVYFCSMRMETC